MNEKINLEASFSLTESQRSGQLWFMFSWFHRIFLIEYRPSPAYPSRVRRMSFVLYRLSPRVSYTSLSACPIDTELLYNRGHLQRNSPLLKTHTDYNRFCDWLHWLPVQSRVLWQTMSWLPLRLQRGAHWFEGRKETWGFTSTETIKASVALWRSMLPWAQRRAFCSPRSMLPWAQRRAVCSPWSMLPWAQRRAGWLGLKHQLTN